MYEAKLLERTLAEMSKGHGLYANLSRLNAEDILNLGAHDLGDSVHDMRASFSKDVTSAVEELDSDARQLLQMMLGLDASPQKFNLGTRKKNYSRETGQKEKALNKTANEKFSELAKKMFERELRDDCVISRKKFTYDDLRKLESHGGKIFDQVAFDSILAINRGGQIVGGFLGRRYDLHVDNISIFWDREQDSLAVKCAPDPEALKGKTVLLCDDRFRSGRHARKAQRWLRDNKIAFQMLVFAARPKIHVDDQMYPEHVVFRCESGEFQLAWDGSLEEAE
jgi:hypothetical protein